MRYNTQEVTDMKSKDKLYSIKWILPRSQFFALRNTQRNLGVWTPNISFKYKHALRLSRVLSFFVNFVMLRPYVSLGTTMNENIYAKFRDFDRRCQHLWEMLSMTKLLKFVIGGLKAKFFSVLSYFEPNITEIIFRKNNIFLHFITFKILKNTTRVEDISFEPQNIFRQRVAVKLTEFFPSWNTPIFMGQWYCIYCACVSGSNSSLYEKQSSYTPFISQLFYYLNMPCVDLVNY